MERGGTIGRTNRALSLTATNQQMKRQRSQEWQQEKNYSSSEEENDRIVGRLNSEANVNGHRKNNSNISPSRDSASVLAQLIAQTQQLSSKTSQLKFPFNFLSPINNVELLHTC